MAKQRTTVADLIAAEAIGAINGLTIVSLDRDEAGDVNVPYAPITGAAVLSPTDHECGIAGCRHGAAHGPAQPDRQVKLECPACGAVARMTARALSVSSGIRCAGGPLGIHDGTDFVVAVRRAYNRRGGAA